MIDKPEPVSSSSVKEFPKLSKFLLTFATIALPCSTLLTFWFMVKAGSDFVGYTTLILMYFSIALALISAISIPIVIRRKRLVGKWLKISIVLLIWSSMVVIYTGYTIYINVKS